ncbi:lysophosphatidylserine lipase ABHD12-like [Plodia interpunctella]|uniref:lysophosphatidylserine lipase ABHD12-like n=1 Tax=Plodia interpunctella TaxID=58824 RepID=UPI0023676A7C|nr:lysophosphatidylserine lipase ABHD12-like [Plodia interpunctella]
MVDKTGIILSVILHVTAVLLLGASISAGLFVIHVAVVPLIFKYCETFRRTIVFLNFVQWPLKIDYEEPASCGVEGARNIRIQYSSRVDGCPVRIGIWHILPKTVYERLQDKFKLVDKEELNKILDKELANSKTPVILYCHGNSNSRAASHRILLYRLFQKMDYHTIAFDYRGYGDSTNLTPSEQGVVEDSLAVYGWLHDTLDSYRDGDDVAPPLFVWGHSLGTGISSNLLGNLDSLSAELQDRRAPLPQPRGLILEAPFNNMADEVANYPLTMLAKWLPYYDYAFIAPFRQSERFSFRSDCHLSRVNSLPILILHAKDDQVVPYVVGERLYRTLVASRAGAGAAVTLHSYSRDQNLGHKYICNAQDLPQVVGDFVNSHR